MKLASVMPTGSSECHAINDDASHPASATATVQRVSAPPPHLPALVEDSNRKGSGDAATISTGTGNGSISSSQESENKRKDDRQVTKRYNWVLITGLVKCSEVVRLLNGLLFKWRSDYRTILVCYLNGDLNSGQFI